MFGSCRIRADLVVREQRPIEILRLEMRAGVRHFFSVSGASRLSPMPLRPRHLH